MNMANAAAALQTASTQVQDQTHAQLPTCGARNLAGMGWNFVGTRYIIVSMNERKEIQDDELADLFADVVKRVLGTDSVKVCGLQEITEADDSYWIVDLCYQASDYEVDPRNNVKLVIEMRKVLFERDDQRMPYVYHNLPEGQPVLVREGC